MCSGVAGSSEAAAPAPSTPLRPPLHPDALESFVDPLPIPPVLESRGHRPDPTHPERELPYYRVTMRQASVPIHRDVPPTPMWTYEGSMPGPTIETRRGAGLLVEWVNELPARHFLPIDHTLHGAGPDQPEVRAVVHVHGGKAPPASDGYPEHWTVPGGSTVAHYPNRQDAATLFYHDHAMGIERLNQYAGLLGCFLVRDDLEDSLDLPKGPHEIPLVLCDRQLDADGQLRYPTSRRASGPWIAELFGDAWLVNGKLRPYVDVEPRPYRLRVVNASNARSFALRFADDRPFHQIGTDQGLLASPVPLSTVSLAPAERADLVVDFAAAAGKRLVLQNEATPLLQVRVASGPRAPTRPLPRVLRPIARLLPSAAAKTRTLALNEYHDAAKGRMLMLLDGKYWHDPVTEKPALDSIEVWNLVNLTEDAHPIHLHLVRFQILDRQLFDADEYPRSGKMLPIGDPVPPPPGEAGWKDTVRADPGMVTRIIVRFEGFAGRYVWHCHILEHADNEMMRPFDVVEPG
jgi:spore coat protein A